MKKNILVFLLGISPVVGHAEVISEQQAYEVAARFFNTGTSRDSRSAQLPLKMVWEGTTKTSRGTGSEAPAFYVFNRGDHQGFVIVAGEDSALPILAYSHTGTFVAEQLPKNLRLWADERISEVALLRQHQVAANTDYSADWIQTLQNEAGTEFVLNTPSWGQGDPYNRKTPLFWNQHAPAGCTIVATATVMGYYKWPDRGVGTLPAYSYMDMYGSSVEVPAMTLGEQYLWDIMPGINNNALDFGNEAQANTLSSLMAHVGSLAKAEYNYSQTGAEPSEVAKQLPVYMKYKRGLKCLHRDNFEMERWTQILLDELKSHHPIVYSGYNATNSAGHAFVLDGFNSQGLFHVNWGWSGMSDGFYALTALAPENQGIGGDPGSSFSYGNYALIDMRPCYDGQEDPEYASFEFVKYAQYPMGLQAQLPQPVKVGSSFKVWAGRVINMGNFTLTTQFRLAHTDKYGHIKDFLYTPAADKTLAPGELAFSLWNSETSDNSVTVTLQKEVAPGDRIRMVFRTPDGNWKPAISDPKLGIWELVLSEDRSVEAPIEITTTASSNLTGHAVATFSAEWPTYTTDVTVEAYYAEVKDPNTVVLKKIEENQGQVVIPAHTGVMLSTPEAKTFSLVPTSQSATHVPASNLLKPTTSRGLIVEDQENAYILSKKGEEVLFHVLSSTYRQIGANRAYLSLPSSLQSASLRMVFEDHVTGVTDLRLDHDSQAPVYDLSGRRVHQLQQGGIYIQNGKKFIVQ